MKRNIDNNRILKPNEILQWSRICQKDWFINTYLPIFLSILVYILSLFCGIRINNSFFLNKNKTKKKNRKTSYKNFSLNFYTCPVQRFYFIILRYEKNEMRDNFEKILFLYCVCIYFEFTCK